MLLFQVFQQFFLEYFFLFENFLALFENKFIYLHYIIRQIYNKMNTEIKKIKFLLKRLLTSPRLEILKGSVYKFRQGAVGKITRKC